MSFNKEIINICYNDLQTNLCPAKYNVLISNAIIKYSGNMPQYSSNTNIIENIRTALDNDNRFSRIGDGYFGLRSWYDLELEGFFCKSQWQRLILDMNYDIIIDSAHEARARQEFIYNKYKDNYLDQFKKIFKGFILERHLKLYFATMFPDNYIPPDNENNYTKSSYDDWLLRFDNKRFSFDAKSIGYDREIYIERNRIAKNRIFVIGEWIIPKVLINGFVDSARLLKFEKNSTNYHYKIKEEDLISSLKFIAYLNHLKLGLEQIYINNRNKFAN